MHLSREAGQNFCTDEGVLPTHSWVLMTKASVTCGSILMWSPVLASRIIFMSTSFPA